ncbi:MAG: hypothetical protein KH135_03420 [Firmicutes bacterium]|nr:hypothetical protein [Bacillota bacterium]
MKQYTDDNIKKMKKITCKIAGDYLGIPAMAVSIGMRNNKLPIGFAHKKEYSNNWTYYIIADRLIAYKNGKLSEVMIENIENSLSTIIKQFEMMKVDLVSLLKELNK